MSGQSASFVLFVPLLVILGLAGWYGLVIRGRVLRGRVKKAEQQEIAAAGGKSKIVVEVYKGRREEAMSQYQGAVQLMAVRGYVPISQDWSPGSYSAGAFILAALLCFAVIGFIIFIYMMIVKPPGSLVVTYELRSIRAA